MLAQGLDLRSRAQTHLQLYTELTAAGYPPEALESVGAAYDCAMELFSGMYRGDGRPFLAHLVGTAAILVRLRAPIDVILAGLLHSAYEFGDFGSGTNGMDAARRSRLVGVVGLDAEGLIAAYTDFAWTRKSITELAARADSLAELERRLVLLRIANVVDEAIDCGFLYCEKGVRLTSLLDQTENDLKQLAMNVGGPELAGVVERLHAEIRSADIPPALRRARPGSFLVAPPSYGQRTGVKFRAILRRLRGKVARPTRRAPARRKTVS